MRKDIDAVEVTCSECDERIGIFAKEASTPQCFGCHNDLCAKHSRELLINEGTSAEFHVILCREHFGILTDEFARVLHVVIDKATNMIKISFIARIVLEGDELANLTAERGFDVGLETVGPDQLPKH